MVIGNFDGVHRGHRAVVAAAVREADERGLAPLVLTFHPHPSEVLGRGKQEVLTPLEHKIELLTRAAPKLAVVVEPFTLELAAKTPRQFAEELLVAELGAGVVIVGDNFRFGKGRAGDVQTLVELGQELGFVAHTHPLEGDVHGPYSSSRIRDAVKRGELGLATSILGRPHALSGTVVEGDGRGRTIGVPTANLAPVPELLPPWGVYACLVDQVDEHGTARALGRGVANIGERPTFDASFSVEVHVLDLDQDLYGQRLRLHLVERLRDERKFDDRDALVAQIQRDIAQARSRLSELSPVRDSWY